MYIEKAAKMTFVQKTRKYNVDEIDTWTTAANNTGGKVWNVFTFFLHKKTMIETKNEAWLDQFYL